MTTILRSPLLRFGVVGCLLVAISACSGEVDESLATGQSGAEEQSRAAIAEPDHFDVEADRALAAQGDADAQGRLAEAYYLGLGASQDFQEALRWARLAADQGSARGQGILAAAYNTGSGVGQDYGEALRWSRLAADQGDSSGQTVLAFLYRNGRGVEQNDEEAVRLLRLAANQGDSSAQFVLGMSYLGGRGVEQDFVSAYMWLSLGTEGPGISDGGARDIAVRAMTPEQLAEAETRVRDWRPEPPLE